jgi:hypothetical protein
LRSKLRLRLALGGAGLALAFAAFAACGACGKSAPGGGPGSATAAASGSAPVTRSSLARDAAPRAGSVVWTQAKDGDLEDLLVLATHEGPAGLVEAAEDPSLRPVALRAMGHARGWSQLPFLTKTAAGNEQAEARLALDAIVELASRPRRAEDPEDVDELREGCDALVALAREAARPRDRRVAAIRALRMMPCPRTELPTDVDAR